MPFFAAADWFEILAALVFLIVTGLAQLVQKRARRGGAPAQEPEQEVWRRPSASTPETGLPPVIESRESSADDWETRLRRMFEDRHPAEAEAPPLLPSDGPTETRPRRVATDHSEFDELGWEPSPVPPPTPVEIGEGPVGPSLIGNRLDVASRLAAAAAAFRQASSLDEAAAARLRAAQERTQNHRLPHSAPAPSGILGATSLRAALLQPQAVRQAILTAAILGPPKGLE